MEVPCHLQSGSRIYALMASSDLSIATLHILWRAAYSLIADIYDKQGADEHVARTGSSYVLPRLLCA